MTGDMNIRNDSIVPNSFFSKIQKKMQEFDSLKTALLETTRNLDNLYKSEANIIADFLYSQGGKDGKISADVWNNSDYADGRTKPISIEEAVETIYKKLQKDAEEKHIQEQQEKLEKLLYEQDLRFQKEQLQEMEEEEIKNSPPKFGE